MPYPVLCDIAQHQHAVDYRHIWPTRFPETSVINYPVMPHNIPEDRIPALQGKQELKISQSALLNWLTSRPTRYVQPQAGLYWCCCLWPGINLVYLRVLYIISVGTVAFYTLSTIMIKNNFFSLGYERKFWKSSYVVFKHFMKSVIRDDKWKQDWHTCLNTFHWSNWKILTWLRMKNLWTRQRVVTGEERDYAVLWRANKINGPFYKLTTSCHCFQVNQLADLHLLILLLSYAWVRVYV